MLHYTATLPLTTFPVPCSLFPVSSSLFPVPELPMPDTFLTPAQFLDHWQGHRRLTRRFIVAFPEKELFEFSVGGMRPFAELATEMFKMALPDRGGRQLGLRGTTRSRPCPTTREELLQHWDDTTAAI